MKIKHTFTLYCLPFTLALFLVSCGTSGDGNGGESFEASDVSAANCADAAALNCFISQWDTTKTADGASYTNTIVLPLVENGEYDFYVDWGDETAIENITEFDAIEVTHTYAEEGEYTIHIAGEIKGWRFFVSEADNEIANSVDDFGDAVKLLDVSQWGSLSLGNTDGRQFQGAANFNATASDAPDLSETTDLSYAFANASKFNAEIGNWDVSKIINMESMFNTASSFNQDISGWTVEQVTSYDSFSKNSGLELKNIPYKFRGNGKVSDGDCEGDDPALNCFISVWNTEKSGGRASDANTIVLPLVDNGEYDFYVDWGDSSPVQNITSYGDATHRYATPGEYSVRITGEIKGWRFFVSAPDNDYGDAVKLLDVSQWGSLSLGNTDGRQFRGAENFNPTASDAPSLSETTSLVRAFQGATVFDGAIGNWDVSTITTMESMFWNADAFDQELSNWDVSAVTSMAFMFWGAKTFNSPLVWGAKTQNVASMASMFVGATRFNQNISGWNVSAVTSMVAMFWAATAFDQDISGWNVSAVTNMQSMFQDAFAFNSPLVWGDKTRNVTNMNNMFQNATLFSQDISGWNVCNVTVANSEDFDVDTPATWTTAKKPNWGMDCPDGDNGGGDTGTDPITFADVSAANCADAAALNCFISQWDTRKTQTGTTGDGVSATSAVELPLVANGEYNFYVDWGDGTPTENITEKAPITHTYATEGEYTIHIAGEIKGWRFFVSGDGVDDYGDAVKLLDVSQWGSLSLGNTDGRQFFGAENFNPTASDAPNLSETTSLARAFQDATNFNGAIGNWDVSTITTMESMFNSAAAFNQHLNAWGEKTQNVTTMEDMFRDATAFDQDIGGWNVSAVTTMVSMFFNAAAFNKNLTAWDVSAVTDMFGMFEAATSFNSPLLWAERTRNVTTMASMFLNAALFDQDIGGWNVSAVTDMMNMLRNAAAFDQDLTRWNVCNVPANRRFNFVLGAAQTVTQLPNWGMLCPDGDNGGDGGDTGGDNGGDGGDTGGDNGGDGGDNGGDGGDTGGDNGGDGGDTGTDPITFADVSEANCADVDAGLSCFISVWNTENSGGGASATNTIVLPLVSGGTYDFYVNWGDGTDVQKIEGYDDKKVAHTHKYDINEKYTIHIAGEIKGWLFRVDNGNYGDAVKLLNVTQWGSLSLGNTAGFQFQGAANFNPTATDAPDLSETTDLSYAFNVASSFDGAIGNWNVSKVTKMDGMFFYASAFNQDISGWKVENVSNMAYMFNGATKFNQNICEWDVNNEAVYVSFANDSALANEHNPFHDDCTSTKSK